MEFPLSQGIPSDRSQIGNSFICCIHSHVYDSVSDTGVIATVYSMNLKVTAEGVEANGRLFYLKRRQSQEVGGAWFYISGTVAPGKAEAFLRDDNRESDMKRDITFNVSGSGSQLVRGSLHRK